jgi:hypothetical protein
VKQHATQFQNNIIFKDKILNLKRETLRKKFEPTHQTQGLNDGIEIDE